MANHVLLGSVVLNTTASGVTFSGIPQSGYTDLKVVVSGRTDTVLAGGGLAIELKLNNVVAAAAVRVQGSSSAVNSDTYQYSNINGSDYTTNIFGNTEFYITNYLSANAKSAYAESVSENNASGAYLNHSILRWSSTSTVTSVVLEPIDGGNFVSGSSFVLYGIAATGTSPSTAPKASGGNIVVSDGTYWYHAFTSSGFFTPSAALSCDMMVVAGGGGAGSNSSAGGGAGGLVGLTSQSLTNGTSYTVTVGAGGVGTTLSGISGTNSQFGGLTAAVGGGYGGKRGSRGGGNGGSGGGGASDANVTYYTAGTGTSGQGNNGYRGTDGGTYLNGGGGGAGAASTGSEGGVGSSAYSTWGAATLTGQLVSSTRYFAGGGGGGSNVGGATTYAGGYGGGGAGTGGDVGNSSNSGTANTGGGAGGTGATNPINGPASGGSGIVIVRYAV